MGKQIVLTPTAQHDLDDIINYLFTEFGILVCEHFLNRFEEVCAIISAMPTMYPLVNKKEKIRKCVLTKHNVIYFRANSEEVELITIFDTRQNPENLKKII